METHVHARTLFFMQARHLDILTDDLSLLAAKHTHTRTRAHYANGVIQNNIMTLCILYMKKMSMYTKNLIAANP